MAVKQITSVEDLISALAEDNENYEGAIWYRGHAVENWPLCPGYYRLDGPPPESTLVKRFKQSAAMLISAPTNDSFDWLFQMQHYGVPTRLLDWSETPLVGLYFAVHDSSKHEGENGALWSLRPSQLNKNAPIKLGYTTFKNYRTKPYKCARRNRFVAINTLASA